MVGYSRLQALCLADGREDPDRDGFGRRRRSEQTQMSNSCLGNAAMRSPGVLLTGEVERCRGRCSHGRRYKSSDLGRPRWQPNTIRRPDSSTRSASCRGRPNSCRLLSEIQDVRWDLVCRAACKWPGPRTAYSRHSQSFSGSTDHAERAARGRTWTKWRRSRGFFRYSGDHRSPAIKRPVTKCSPFNPRPKPWLSNNSPGRDLR